MGAVLGKKLVRLVVEASGCRAYQSSSLATTSRAPSGPLSVSSPPRPDSSPASRSSWSMMRVGMAPPTSSTGWPPTFPSASSRIQKTSGWAPRSAPASMRPRWSGLPICPGTARCRRGKSANSALHGGLRPDHHPARRTPRLHGLPAPGLDGVHRLGFGGLWAACPGLQLGPNLAALTLAPRAQRVRQRLLLCRVPGPMPVCAASDGRDRDRLPAPPRRAGEEWLAAGRAQGRLAHHPLLL